MSILLRLNYMLLVLGPVILLMYSINSIDDKWPSSNSLGIKSLGIFDNELSQSSAMFGAAIVLSQQYNMTVNGYHIG